MATLGDLIEYIGIRNTAKIAKSLGTGYLDIPKTENRQVARDFLAYHIGEQLAEKIIFTFSGERIQGNQTIAKHYEMYEMRKQGHSYGTIAKQYRCAKSTVYDAIRNIKETKQWQD